MERDEEYNFIAIDNVLSIGKYSSIEKEGSPLKRKKKKRVKKE